MQKKQIKKILLTKSNEKYFSFMFCNFFSKVKNKFDFYLKFIDLESILKNKIMKNY